MSRVLMVTVVLGLLSGCYLDSIVHDKDKELAFLQEERNRLRREKAELAQQVARDSLQDQVATPDALAQLRRRLEKAGIEVTMDGAKLILTVANSILFQPGRSVLRPEAQRALREVANVLNNDYHQNQIRIEGHTDSDKIRKSKNRYKDNWELSMARSLAVHEFLREKCGVPTSRMYAAGYAYTRPVAPNDTESGKARNRRVDIVILPNIEVALNPAR